MISGLPGRLFQTFWRAAAQSKCSGRRVSSAGRFAFACCAEDVFSSSGRKLTQTGMWQVLLHVVRFHVFKWIVLHIPAQHLSLVGVASLISPPQTDMHFMGCSK